MKHKFPKILSSQFAVLQVELSTGVLLTIDGNRFLGEGDCYHIFDSLDMARAFSNQKVNADPEIECVIKDSSEEVVDVVRNEAYVKGLLDKAREERKKKSWFSRFIHRKSET